MSLKFTANKFLIRVGLKLVIIGMILSSQFAHSERNVFFMQNVEFGGTPAGYCTVTVMNVSNLDQKVSIINAGFQHLNSTSLALAMSFVGSSDGSTQDATGWLILKPSQSMTYSATTASLTGSTRFYCKGTIKVQDDRGAVIASGHLDVTQGAYERDSIVSINGGRPF